MSSLLGHWGRRVPVKLSPGSFKDGMEPQKQAGTGAQGRTHVTISLPPPLVDSPSAQSPLRGRWGCCPRLQERSGLRGDSDLCHASQ